MEKHPLEGKISIYYKRPSVWDSVMVAVFDGSDEMATFFNLRKGEYPDGRMFYADSSNMAVLVGDHITKPMYLNTGLSRLMETEDLDEFYKKNELAS